MHLSRACNLEHSLGLRILDLANHPLVSKLQSVGYSRGGYNIRLRILDLANHSLVQRLQSGTVSGYEFWISGSNHWTGGLHSGGLQSRATDFGSRDAITELGAYSVGAYSLGPHETVDCRLLAQWLHFFI